MGDRIRPLDDHRCQAPHQEAETDGRVGRVRQSAAELDCDASGGRQTEHQR